MARPTAPDSLPGNNNAITSTRPDSSLLLLAGVAATRRRSGTSCRHTHQQDVRHLQYPTQQRTREDIAASIIDASLAIVEQDDKGNIVALRCFPQ